MVYREDVEILTKYRSSQELYEDMKNLKRDSFFKQPFKNELVGTFYEDHHFLLSSAERFVGLFVFKGQIVKRAESIVLIGDIEVRKFVKGYAVILLCLSILFSFYLMSNMAFKENIWRIVIIAALIGMSVFINIYIRYSNSLYKLLMKKLSNRDGNEY